MAPSGLWGRPISRINTVGVPGRRKRKRPKDVGDVLVSRLTQAGMDRVIADAAKSLKPAEQAAIEAAQAKRERKRRRAIEQRGNGA